MTYRGCGCVTGKLYMTVLCVHRKRCERDGKYLEARAASVRLAELKTQEAQRMRQAIMERQVCIAICLTNGALSNLSQLDWWAAASSD